MRPFKSFTRWTLRRRGGFRLFNRQRPFRQKTRVLSLPSCVKPSDEEKQEIFDHLLFDRPVQFVRSPRAFRGEIPAGYVWLPRQVQPSRRSGFGDFIHNLVVHKESAIEWGYGSHDEFQLRGGIPARWTTGEIQLAKESFPYVQIERMGSGSHFVIPRMLCQPATISSLRNFILYSGLFPVWTVDTVQTDSYPKWLHEHQAKPLSWRVL